MDPDQAQPDLDPNCLQRLSVDNNGGQRVNPNYILKGQNERLKHS